MFYSINQMKFKKNGVKRRILGVIFMVLFMSSLGNALKELKAETITIHNPTPQEQEFDESRLCELNDVVCESELPEYDKEGEFTAYNATEAQCDDTPEIMASGKKIYAGAIACPAFYDFGTKIDIEGIGVFTCEDRMNIRYRNGEYFDILLDDKQDALNFGRKSIAYRVIK